MFFIFILTQCLKKSSECNLWLLVLCCIFCLTDHTSVFCSSFVDLHILIPCWQEKHYSWFCFSQIFCRIAQSCSSLFKQFYFLFLSMARFQISLQRFIVECCWLLMQLFDPDCSYLLHKFLKGWRKSHCWARFGNV